MRNKIENIEHYLIINQISFSYLVFIKQQNQTINISQTFPR